MAAYKSSYYDPAKAHEYYEAHKQLKSGKKRASTSSLNDQGKAVAAVVKDKITEERKKMFSGLSDIMKGQIKSMREKMKGLKGDERKAMKEKIKAQVTELRGKYEDIKSKMSDFYQEKYLQELDKIKGDKSLLKAYTKKK